MAQKHVHVRLLQEILTPPNPEPVLKRQSQHLSQQPHPQLIYKAAATLFAAPHHSRLMCMQI